MKSVNQSCHVHFLFSKPPQAESHIWVRGPIDYLSGPEVWVINNTNLQERWPRMQKSHHAVFPFLLVRKCFVGCKLS